MKLLFWFQALFTILVIAGCTKEKGQSGIPSSQTSFSDSALTFLQATLTKDDFKQVDISTLTILKDNRRNIGFSIIERSGNNLQMLLLRRVNNTFDGNKVNFSQLHRSSSGRYSGEIFLKTLQNGSLNKIMVEENKVVSVLSSVARINSVQPGTKIAKSSRLNSQVLEEVFVIGYIPARSPDYASLYWLFNQDTYFNHQYINNVDFGAGGNSMGANSTTQIVTAPTFISPEHPVKNIVEELKCFTINNQNSYSVTVNVNQPNPNTRDLTDLAADHIAGHTFISLNERYPDGSTMVRNIGFYPLNGAKPGSQMDKSVFGDDSETSFSVSLNISVTAAEFGAIRNAIYSQQNKNYYLESFNCTNSVITSLKAGNVNLPETSGGNALFIGMNPADLGQDIREMNLNKFSAENGGRKIIRSVNDVNTMKAPPRAGGC